MARLNNIDALEDLNGKLSISFRGVALHEWQDRLIADQPAPQQENAASIVKTFYEAAEKLQSREAVFNRNAKPGITGLNLKANLRSPEHITDMRSFHQARQDLLALSGHFGQKIATMVEGAMTEKIISAKNTNMAKPQATFSAAVKSTRKTL